MGRIGRACRRAEVRDNIHNLCDSTHFSAGVKVARVALARKMAGIVYHVWKRGTGFYALVRRGDVRG